MCCSDVFIVEIIRQEISCIICFGLDRSVMLLFYIVRYRWPRITQMNRLWAHCPFYIPHQYNIKHYVWNWVVARLLCISNVCFCQFAIFIWSPVKCFRLSIYCVHMYIASLILNYLGYRVLLVLNDWLIDSILLMCY